MGRAPRTKKTLPDFCEWCWVTRHSRVFRWLTGCQRTPGFGASQYPTEGAWTQPVPPVSLLSRTGFPTIGESLGNHIDLSQVSGSDLLEPRNDRDVHVGLGIRFLSSTKYNHLSGAHDLCGTRSTWLCLFSLGPSSSETATSKTSHAAPCIGLETPRPSGG